MLLSFVFPVKCVEFLECRKQIPCRLSAGWASRTAEVRQGIGFCMGGIQL